ncbi:MAG: DUF4402 domain-containing protein [Alphaproteobacteria bacterium]|nr:DUF4402 domain-containing protein [Alphaproteobacteria bacterium]
MRKYFLLGAVALLAASNVNAQVPTLNAGNMEVAAQILIGESMDCSQGLMFVPIILDSGTNHTITVATDGKASFSDSNILGSGTPGSCTLTEGTFAEGGQGVTIIAGDGIFLYPSINKESSSVVSVENFVFQVSDDRKTLTVGATLNIPAGTDSDVYMGTLDVGYMVE